jgi:arylsulfatase A-like enzyme
MLVALAEVSAQSSDPARPNVIVILADDLGYSDLGCYGQQRFDTPRLDGMAAEGMRFTQFYAGSTVCAPSRAVLLTGLHTGHARIRGNGTVNGQPVRLYPEDVTIAELLNPRGYRTACIGKWGCGEEGSTGIPNEQGFDDFYGFLNQSRAHFYYSDWVWRNTEKVTLEGNDPEKQTGAFVHTLFTGEALEFVRENAGAPFFLYLTFTIPHAELVATAEEIDAFDGRFGPEPAFEKNHYGAQPRPRAAFAAMVTMLDRDVGRLLDLLRELGIDRNTFVLFTSDNGPHKEGGHDYQYFDSNGPLRGTKRDLYEGGVRVPAIAWWPGTIAPGTTSDHIAASWDLLPTIADLTGTPTPEGLDGISFAPTLRGARADQREHKYLYWEFFEEGGKTAVRLGDWKGVRLGLFKNADAPLELYDLATDIGETNNVAADHPDIVARMLEMMRNARTPSPDYSFDR